MHDAMHDAPVLVTGATGNIGRAAVASLRHRGLAVRAAGRDEHHVRAVLDDDEVDAVHLDLHDPSTFDAAVAGASGLLLVRPPAITRVGPTLNTLIDVAAHRGVDHFVFSSVAGADTNPLVPHHRVETHLRRSGLSWTILRPGFFAQNLGDAYRRDIREDDRLFLPSCDAPVAWIDVRDLGDMAAAVFANPVPHRGRGYHLTGPEAVRISAVAAQLTRALGRPIRHVPASVPGYVRHLRGRGLTVPNIVVLTLLHLGLRRGDAAAVDPTMADLLDHPPRTIADYINDHAALWQRDSPGSTNAGST